MRSQVEVKTHLNQQLDSWGFQPRTVAYFLRTGFDFLHATLCHFGQNTQRAIVHAPCLSLPPQSAV